MTIQELIEALSAQGITATAEQLEAELGSAEHLTADDIPAVAEMLGATSGRGGAVRKSGKSAGKLAKASTATSTHSAVPAVAADINPSESLANAQKLALDAATRAAATMGDSTSGLFEQVESKLQQKRAERDAQLAENIADQVFSAENATLGKSFTALLGYVQQFDPYKGTVLEGMTGSSTVDINQLLAK